MYTCTKFILISPNFIPTSPIIAFYFSIQMPRFNKYSYRCLFLINVLQISNVCLFPVLDSSKLKMWFIARPSNKKLPPYITTLTLSSIISDTFLQHIILKFTFERSMHACLFLLECACVSICTHVCRHVRLRMSMVAKRGHWKFVSISVSLSLRGRVYSWTWDSCLFD